MIENNLLHLKIDELIEKYNDNEYILNKLHNYVLNILPNILENKMTENINNIERKNKIYKEIDIYVNSFLSIHKFFYSKKHIYFYYDNNHFSIISEDNVYHKILTNISLKKKLLPYKYKIKNIIIKKIKTANIFDCIPESDTVQYIINLLVPNIFSNRNYVKHFLTAIGDQILNKNNTIYICNLFIKEFIDKIKYFYNTNFNNGFLNNFKFKYHEHKYSNCRFFKTNKTINIDKNIYKNIIDLLCVSCYYSKRYENADNFVETSNDIKLYENVFFTKNISDEILVDNFLKFSIKKFDNLSIKKSHMIFLWKKYLDKHNVPNIMFYDNLINILNSKLDFDINTNNYLNITSIYLPDVTKFIDFFDENIIIYDIDSDNSNDNIPDFIYFEIDEIITMFHYYYKNTCLNDELVLELINTLYNDVLIENNKYILNIKCNLWNKYNDIEEFLEQFIENFKSNYNKFICNLDNNIDSNVNSNVDNNVDSNVNEKFHINCISLCDLYKKYINNNIKFKMSKKCFEDICKDIIPNNFINNEIISNDYWFL